MSRFMCINSSLDYFYYGLLSPFWDKIKKCLFDKVLNYPTEMEFGTHVNAGVDFIYNVEPKNSCELRF
jgi:hypothetical protein